MTLDSKIIVGKSSFLIKIVNKVDTDKISLDAAKLH